MEARLVTHHVASYVISLEATCFNLTFDVRVPIRIFHEFCSKLDSIERILRDPCSELDVTLEGLAVGTLRGLQGLQKLDDLLEESLRLSSHSQEKRNESRFASGIQDRVKPLPWIRVSFFEGKSKSLSSDCYVDALLDLVVKFRTKLHIAFITPDESGELLLQTGIGRNSVGLAKLAVAMEPLRISKNSCLCPATLVAKLMKCASVSEVMMFLLATRGTLQFQPNSFINKLPYPRGIRKTYHENQKLPGVWNLAAEVHGILPPTAWARTEFKAQGLKLQVTLQPVVTGACSMAIGVRNVQVRIQDAFLDSSPSNVLGFFLSHITVSIRPEVERQLLFMQLEVPSPNEPYDISATRTIGFSASATVSQNPGIAVTATESSSATIKSTTDWHHEQTEGDEFTGNFSWTLLRLAGVPFDHAQPKCTKISIFRPRPVTSVLKLPFNSDGSVTFSEQCPKAIKWTLAPELAGTDVVWSVSATVHLTILNRSTGTGITREIWSPHHFLHNMSTDVECTHS
ncbi:unnamed protein product [Sphagnum troendelagicum]|uniref:Uncharacterized protein n=1 Tax=Sphagnum troendelagicum TaxID=128251 RepID=A0ABP0T843_9BRYO